MNRLLAAAAADGERELAELLAVADSAGQTALHRAAVAGHTHVVNALLDRGAPAGAPNNFEQSPLHLAARGGRASTARALLAAGADREAALPATARSTSRRPQAAQRWWPCY